MTDETKNADEAVEVLTAKVAEVQVVADTQDIRLTAMRSHLRSIYAALGIEWGEDPLPVIAGLQRAAIDRDMRDE